MQQLNGTTYGVFDPRITQITDTYQSTGLCGHAKRRGQRKLQVTRITDKSYISLNSPLTEDAPLIIISYPEVKLIEAEAALRAGLTERAYRNL